MKYVTLVLMLCANFVFAYDYFPTNGWKTRELDKAGFDQSKFQEFLDYVWDPKAKYTTDGIVIIKDGYLVYEGYSKEYDKNKKHMLWSLSKSVTSIILGAAIKDGILSLEDKAHKYYPVLEKGDKKEITLDHILHMSSGFDYWEEHPFSTIFSDSISIHYSRWSYRDIGETVARLKLKHRPGTKFKYGAHETSLAMGVLKKAMNDQAAYNTYPWTAVFNKLGIQNIAIEQDMSGTFIGGGLVWTNAREYAKFGLLMLNKGNWDGEQVISREYAEYVTTVPAEAQFNETNERKVQRLNRESYGGYFWLNQKLPMNKKGRPDKGTPSDIFKAYGFKGQMMAVFPSEDLIIVRLASDGRKKKEKINKPKTLELLLKSLKTLNTTEELSWQVKRKRGQK